MTHMNSIIRSSVLPTIKNGNRPKRKPLELKTYFLMANGDQGPIVDEPANYGLGNQSWLYRVTFDANTLTWEPYNPNGWAYYTSHS